MEDIIEPFTLIATDRNGVPHQFNVSVTVEVVDQDISQRTDETYTEYSFLVSTPEPPADGEVYEFAVVRFAEDCLIKVIQMNNHRSPAYMRKGITPALLDWVSNHFQSTIESSSNIAAFKRLNAEYRTPDADRVWEDLVAGGRARKEEERDVYIHFIQPVITEAQPTTQPK
jgi:hypothetical protein